MSAPREPQQVVLVRHGATDWSASGRHTSRTDLELTEEGRADAARLRAPLSAWTFDAVLTSPMRRAIETCRLAGFGDVAVARSDLCEWDYGAYEGRTTAQIRADRPGWSLWLDEVPGGETIRQVAARTDRVIDEMRAVPGNVLLFAHGHVLRILASRWLGVAPDAGRFLVLDAATISVLGYERETAAIRRWNQPV